MPGIERVINLCTRGMRLRAERPDREARRMAKELKVYQTAMGFFDLAVAAPSMKAALQAWGADRNLFREGVAKQSDDPDIIAAAMAKPGLVLRRPVGSSARFQENAELPTYLAAGGSDRERPKSTGSKSTGSKSTGAKATGSKATGSKATGSKSTGSTKRQQQRTDSPATERKAALAFAHEQERRELERRKQEAAQRKKHEQRERAIGKARAALDAARRKHEKQAAEMRVARDALESKSQAEDARWEKERARLELVLRRAQDSGE